MAIRSTLAHSILIICLVMEAVLLRKSPYWGHRFPSRRQCLPIPSTSALSQTNVVVGLHEAL